MADVRPEEGPLLPARPEPLPRVGWALLPGGRTDLPPTAPTTGELLRTLPIAFARFCELCPEHGLVQRQNLVAGVLALARAAHPGTEFSPPSAEGLDLPIAAAVRDALWQAGRSGRLEPLRAALAQAQLRLSLWVR